jgi:hypothetical protein
MSATIDVLNPSKPKFMQVYLREAPSIILRVCPAECAAFQAAAA